MSREYYPTNSGVIDLRARVVRTPASKTKRIFDELSQSSTSPHLKMPKKSSPPGELYEVERWAIPRPESSLGVPPRRSMFTPSRLQDFASQLERESKKPYWRCPKPLQRLGESSRTVKTLSSEASEEIRAIDVRCVEPKDTPVGSGLTGSPQRRHAAKVVTMPRRREIKPGFKPNVFSIDAEELQVDVSGGEESTLAQLPPLRTTKAPEPGFLCASPPPIYTFAAPVLRAPKCPSPPLSRDMPMQQPPSSSSSIDATRETPAFVKKPPKGSLAETEQPTATNDSTTKDANVENGSSSHFVAVTTAGENESGMATTRTAAGVTFDLAASSTSAGGGFQFGLASPASTSDGVTAAAAPPPTALFGTSPPNGKENIQFTDGATKAAPQPVSSGLFAFGVTPTTQAAPADTGVNGIQNGSSNTSGLAFGGTAPTQAPNAAPLFNSNSALNTNDQTASTPVFGILPSKNPLDASSVVKASIATNGGGFQFGAPATSLSPMNSAFNFGTSTAAPVVNGSTSALGVPPPNGLFTFGTAPAPAAAPLFSQNAASFPPSVQPSASPFAFGQGQPAQLQTTAPDPFSSLPAFASNFPLPSALQPSGNLASNVFAQEPSTGGGRKMLIPKRKRPNK